MNSDTYIKTLGVLALARHAKELTMHTEFIIKIEFHAPKKSNVRVFTQACKDAAQLLATQAALLSGTTPSVNLTVESGAFGTRQYKVFESEVIAS